MTGELSEHVQDAQHVQPRAAALQRLWRHDLSLVLERVVQTRVLPPKVAEHALVEYRKFMTLCLLDDEQELPMLSAEVDEIWHAHLLHTRDYAEFCEQVFGHFVHHEPLDGGAPDPALPDYKASFFRAYRERFGTPSYLWGPSAS